MNKFYTTMVVLAAFAVAVPASAQGCEMTTSEPEVTVGEFYVDNDPCQPDCTISLWVYQESNGFEGLQRADESKDDTCGHPELGDTVIL